MIVLAVLRSKHQALVERVEALEKPTQMAVARKRVRRI